MKVFERCALAVSEFRQQAHFNASAVLCLNREEIAALSKECGWSPDTMPTKYMGLTIRETKAGGCRVVG